MQALSLSIHNFRSICDATIALCDMTLLVGVNNAGKSTVIDAIRAFYNKLKFDREQDFPYKGSCDDDSWVEIEFQLNPTEAQTLKSHYLSNQQTLQIRAYFCSEEKKGSYLFNHEQHTWDPYKSPKLGQIIYIPALSKIDDHTKLTGPSALRDLLNSILSQVISQSPAYQILSQAFDTFESAIKSETTAQGHSLSTLEAQISEHLQPWGTQFSLNIKPVSLDDLIKNLIQHTIFDQALGSAQPIGSYGQGFQRNVIYALIRIAAQYTTPSKPTSDFDPTFTWILFEEPEAFLHTTQISQLNRDLRALSQTENTQILITTHNPHFATHSIRDLTSICRLQRNDCQSHIYQISPTDLDQIIADNGETNQAWKLADITIHDDDFKAEMESIKYSLWLDNKRCGSFFAEKVLLVEGPTETALISYMCHQGLLPSCDNVYTLDTIGKYNIHRFMRLFEFLGIKHYVLYDQDSNKNKIVNDTIQSSENKHTGGIDYFPKDLESYLGITDSNGSHRKPQHLLFQIEQNKIDLNPLAQKINKLLS